MDFGYVDYTKEITRDGISGFLCSGNETRYRQQRWKQEQTGLHQENGKYYYVNENGERVSDQWVTVNGKTYYISSDGYALMGMKKVDGKCYWFHTKSGYMFKNRRVTRSTGDIYYLEATVYAARMECTKSGKKWGAHLIISGKTEKRIRDG